MEKSIKEKIRLVETCYACPEQYDAFIGEKQVGYLRLRHGYFRVDFPDCNGEVIYTAYPEGDGIFDEDEREFFLDRAKEAIILKILEKSGKDILEKLLDKYEKTN